MASHEDSSNFKLPKIPLVRSLLARKNEPLMVFLAMQDFANFEES